jgi:nicotinic acetylcholine receptor
LFNNADQRLENKRDALVVIYSDGEMMWVPTSIFRSTCSIDIKYFPFDQQNCSMVFGNLNFISIKNLYFIFILTGSWTYESNKLDLLFVENRSSVDLAEYFPSNEW